MTKFARFLAATTVAAATFAATPALAVPVGATTPATAKAQIVRPLSLTAKTNMDFGTILLSSVAVGPTYTVILTSGGALARNSKATRSLTGHEDQTNARRGDVARNQSSPPRGLVAASRSSPASAVFTTGEAAGVR